MTYRDASKIRDTDSATDAEYKAAMAKTTLCEATIQHCTRVLALIDYATTHRVLADLERLYPLAFAVIPTIDAAGITHDQARRLAQIAIDEIGLDVHELDWSYRKPAPASADDELLRRSRAIVAEDEALQQLADFRSKLHVFETALMAHQWATAFDYPTPFARTDPSRRPQ
ncbi:hypothetical protein GS896_27800 [Rhodococcus hoagii]|nr:hypothetical protein [Prescottella equi]MBM4654058.1 hypothetical protein [Prescottella equi]MBM4654205.1 hypothetical protein [Prescottella equi]NKR23476.1 hypothetical protein [Prescottella equi]NKT55912.1 hypothetical protein [Prescottella equi]